MYRLLGLFFMIFLFSCSNNSTNRNPYLQEFSFRFDINTNLPRYSNLTNEGSAIYVPSEQAGTRGLFVIKTQSAFSGYRAFEASCPNHAPNECSTMTLDTTKNSVTCACEDYNYILFTGQLLNAPEDGTRFYNMLEYNVTANGNIISVTN